MINCRTILYGIETVIPDDIAWHPSPLSAQKGPDINILTIPTIWPEVFTINDPEDPGATGKV